LAGAFLFLPLLARLRLDQLVQPAGYPGSPRVPATQAFLGLKSFLTDYSYRTKRNNRRALLLGWVRAWSGLLLDQPQAFALDFHPTPYRGEGAELEQHPIPTRGRACPRVLSFFALEQGSRTLCYANANRTRAEQAGEVRRFVEFWHEVTGTDPNGLYFDGRGTTYEERSRWNQRGVHFGTIRRRGASIIKRLRGWPMGEWRRPRSRGGGGGIRRYGMWMRGCACGATRGRCGRWRWTAWGGNSRRCC
jgi:hypothetical protein